LESDYLYVEISQLPDAGQGLFTAVDIFEEEVITLFEGELLSEEEAASRKARGEDSYFINMIDGTTLDSKHTPCFAKYANDAEGFSSSPFKNNAKISLNEEDKVCLIALRKINSGEEIFCGYGEAYWKRLTI